MAVKYAISNGRWDNAAIWNDGVIPTIDDDVYLDNHIINIANQTATAHIISNGVNELTGNTGGSMQVQATNATSTLINATLQCAYSIVTPYNVDFPYLTINGDLHINTQAATFAINFSTNRAKPHVVINGNVFITSGRILGDSGVSNTDGANYTINGNIKEYAQQSGAGTLFGMFGSYQKTPKLTINGNIDVFTQAFPTYSTGSTYGANTMPLIINGIYTARSTNLVINKNLFKVNEIRYSGKFPFILYWFITDENFKVQCIDTPTINPYIIINPNTITQTYPPENKVLSLTIYGAQMELVGTFEPNYPPESVVLDGFEYGENMTGTMTQSVQVGCVTKEDVREGVALLGMGENGTLVVPSADDVREGVVFDNGTIGTLIVQGGGDRLRIADFGYYTNAQSDTYIVDITEADKPKFASAEERILVEMFPDLDLDNIPDMYFDDLFVKYLKYRLIVEYYRTAGINSTFTPSEPTTEIVNYRNVTCEVWLNSANTYLNAWNKKYDLNKPPKEVRL